VRSIEYRHQQARSNVYALGSTKRIGMVSGGEYIEGRLRVASTSDALNGMVGDQLFQVVATFVHGTQQMKVSFTDCYLLDKSFSIETDGYGEAVYTFSADSIKEEISEVKKT